MFSRLICCVLLALVATPLQASDFSNDEWLKRAQAENSIDQLGRLYVEFLLEEDPANSGSFGIHGKADQPAYYDDRLADISAESLAATAQARAAFLARLQSIDANKLSRPDQIDLH
ncbi:MAG TPA: hypothetical protein VJN01_06300, partial [Xanthomonadales bacterium]|nr:hypothetical protein [Xanthomonadales bacterium]